MYGDCNWDVYGELDVRRYATMDGDGAKHSSMNYHRMIDMYIALYAACI